MPLAGLLVGLKPCLWSKTTSTKTCTHGDIQLSVSDMKRTRENAVELSDKSHDHNSVI